MRQLLRYSEGRDALLRVLEGVKRVVTRRLGRVGGLQSVYATNTSARVREHAPTRHEENGLRRLRISRRAGVLAALLLLTSAACGKRAEEWAAGSERMDLYRQEMTAVAAAQQAQDGAAYAKHQDAAQTNLREARRIFEQSKAGESKDPDVLVDYAEVLFNQGDFDLAADAWRSATQTKSGKTNPWFWFQLGRSLSALEGESYNLEAVEALRKAMALNPEPAGMANAQAVLGRVYWRLGLYDLAESNLAEAAQRAPGDLGIVAMLATLRVRDGHVREAADAFDAMGFAPPEYTVLLESALDDFAQRREWFTDTAEDHLAYAKLLVRLARFGDAMAPLERSLKLDPDNVVAWNLLGSINRQRGDTDAARVAFQRSLDVDPDQPRTRAALDALAPEASASPGTEP